MKIKQPKIDARNNLRRDKLKNKEQNAAEMQSEAKRMYMEQITEMK